MFVKKDFRLSKNDNLYIFLLLCISMIITRLS